MTGPRRARPAPGGGQTVEVPPERLPGWITRFAARHEGLAEPVAQQDFVQLTAGDGTLARLSVPFPPMAVGAREGIEALLDHVRSLGPLGIVLVRAGAHSVGVCAGGVVTVSSTDTHYVQGRTAAGGWSQQRYARRRGNQLSAAQQRTAADAARLFAGRHLDGLILGGDVRSMNAVLDLLPDLDSLPRREFRDIPEPRRAVLDAVATRSLNVSVLLTPPPALAATHSQ